MVDGLAAALLGLGALAFLCGTIGLLRFPDVFARLHAITKADNLGLGLVVVALALRATSWAVVVKLLLVWALVLLASATSSHLVARRALADGVVPWRRPGGTG